jgi:hypothetical protein
MQLQSELLMFPYHQLGPLSFILWPVIKEAGKEEGANQRGLVPEELGNTDTLDEGGAYY